MVRIISCPHCGSNNLRLTTAEFAFEQDGKKTVYSVIYPMVCLDCGTSRVYMSSETLDDLRPSFPNSPRNAGRPQTTCANCNSSRIKLFESVEIAFGLGKGPPVHLASNPSINICFGCGLSEFVIQGQELTQVRAGIGVIIRPPAPALISKRARGTA